MGGDGRRRTLDGPAPLQASRLGVATGEVGTEARGGIHAQRGAGDGRDAHRVDLLEAREVARDVEARHAAAVAAALALATHDEERLELDKGEQQL